MPTYQYKCNKCNNRFEEVQLITEAPISRCPRCGGAVERLITGGAGFLFKGSGFYTTDYRSESYKKSAEMDKPKSKPATSVKKDDKPTPAVKTGKNSDT